MIDNVWLRIWLMSLYALATLLGGIAVWSVIRSLTTSQSRIVMVVTIYVLWLLSLPIIVFVL